MEVCYLRMYICIIPSGSVLRTYVRMYIRSMYYTECVTKVRIIMQAGLYLSMHTKTTLSGLDTEGDEGDEGQLIT